LQNENFFLIQKMMQQEELNKFLQLKYQDPGSLQSFRGEQLEQASSQINTLKA